MLRDAKTGERSRRPPILRRAATRRALSALSVAAALALAMTRESIANERAFASSNEQNGANKNVRKTMSERARALVGARSSFVDARNANQRECYGNVSSAFDAYTMMDSIASEDRDAVVSNMLRWTTKHDARLCVWNAKSDGSRKSSWNKVAAVVEGLSCSSAKFAMWLDADAVIQNMLITPDQVLMSIEREVGAEAFARTNIFFSAEFGDLKDRGNPINAGVFFMRVNDRSVRFFERVWNDFHGISLFHRPEHLEQDALWRFYDRDRRAFDADAAVVSFKLFNDPSAGADDFIRHYAGAGRGRGSARKVDKFTTLARELKLALEGEPLLARRERVVYPGFTRFARPTTPPRIFLRLFPTHLERRACTPELLARGRVLAFRG